MFESLIPYSPSLAFFYPTLLNVQEITQASELKMSIYENYQNVFKNPTNDRFITEYLAMLASETPLRQQQFFQISLLRSMVLVAPNHNDQTVLICHIDELIAETGVTGEELGKLNMFGYATLMSSLINSGKVRQLGLYGANITVEFVIEISEKLFPAATANFSD
jgi:hypothetical protein